MLQSFMKKLAEVEPFTTIAAFIILIDEPNTFEILQKFIATCKTKPWKIDGIKRALSGKHRQETPCGPNGGTITIKALYPKDILLSQGIGKPFEVLKYLEKTSECEEGEIAYAIKSTFVGSTEETLCCKKTPEGLVISGYKKHTPRSKFD